MSAIETDATEFLFRAVQFLFYGGRKMKRIVHILLVLVMILSLFACGSDTDTGITERADIEDEKQVADTVATFSVGASSAQKYSAGVIAAEADTVSVDGSSVSGFVFEKGVWKYYLKGVMQTGWVKDGGKWYYMNSAGVMQTGWINDGGKWYYTDIYGAMQTGWVCAGGIWYYMNASGVMQTGWEYVSGKWYYMDASGAMQTGWINDGGKWYYTDVYGAMQTGWVCAGGIWYYMNASGAMQTGWEKVSGKWYYMDASGAMQTGWVKDCDIWYCLDEYGALKTGTTANGDIMPRPGNGTYGYRALGKEDNGKEMQEIYRLMLEICEAFVKSGNNVGQTNGDYPIGIVSLNGYEVSTDEVIAVWKVFYCENPRYYWLSNSVSIGGSELQLCIDGDYAEAAYRKQCDAAIDRMVLSFGASVTDGLSELEMSMSIHDFIIDSMNYAYETDGVTPEDDIWAHNIVGCALYDLGVCESYSKTYQYLCLLNGIECINVTGDAGGNHAWNITRIDGIWYGVDCTWDETNTENISYSCFGMSKGSLAENHTADSPDGVGTDYLYELPELSDKSVQLVYLYKEHVYLGTYGSMDAAFEEMTDRNGNYVIKLFEYDLNGPLLMGAPAVEHTVTSSQTPYVKSIRIVGRDYDLGNGYHTSMTVAISGDISVNSDLILDNVGIKSNNVVNINSHELRFEGFHFYVFFGKLIGSENSKLIASCREEVDLIGIIDVDAIEINNSTVIRGPEVYVNKIFGTYQLRFYGEELKKVEIGDLNVGIQFDNCEAPDIKIKNIGVAGDDFRGYIQLFVCGMAGEKLPIITVTDRVDTKIIYIFYGSKVTVVTDIGGNELDRYVQSDTLDANTVLIKGDGLTYDDFYYVQEQIDRYNSSATEIVESKLYYTEDVSRLLTKNSNGEFVFVGWSEDMRLY